MPDYIYLLENRLSPDQRNALSAIRDAARDAQMILFLTGDAVRDLTSGHAVRDLEVSVHGNALKLKKALEKAGAKVWGEDADSHSLFLCFPGTVRVDVVSTQTVEFPKPGKAVLRAASIQEELRRRDFTVNAMAISLNEGSFGLLMDPLNGAADIESRSLRLVSNYGFLEDPSLLIRAIRYKARLGWELDPRTQTRYDNAKMEGVIEHLSETAKSRELEQIGHEEEGLKVLKALEDEGWMKVLFPAWTSAKADETKLKALHDLAVELFMQGVHPDMSAGQMQLLTSGLSSKDLAALKKSLLRPGFVEEWNSLDAIASGFQKVLLAKQNATPSASYQLFTSYDPEAVLWLGFTSKAASVQERYNDFLKVWPEARQRIPYVLMMEMRITPDLPKYAELVHAIFLQLIDGKLTTPEEMRAYLEPHSPPAPPPQVTVKRSRVRREARAKVIDEEDEESEDGDDEDIDLGISLGKGELDEVEGDDEEEEKLEEDEGDEDDMPPARKMAGKKGEPAKTEKPAAKAAPAKETVKEAAKPVPAKQAAKSVPAVAAKPKAVPPPPPIAAKAVPGKATAKSAAKPAPAAKPAATVKTAIAKPAPAAKPVPPKGKPAPLVKKAAPAPVKKAVKQVQAKPAPKKAAKPAPRPAVKAKPAKPAAKKPTKVAKKR